MSRYYIHVTHQGTGARDTSQRNLARPRLQTTSLSDSLQVQWQARRASSKLWASRPRSRGRFAGRVQMTWHMHTQCVATGTEAPQSSSMTYQWIIIQSDTCTKEQRHAVGFMRYQRCRCTGRGALVFSRLACAKAPSSLLATHDAAACSTCTSEILPGRSKSRQRGRLLGIPKP